MTTAANRFKQGYGTGQFQVNGTDQLATYRNHYNKKLAKCIVALNVVAFPAKSKKENGSVTIDLWDILENRLIGSFYMQNGESETSQCFVEQARCSNKTQWEALVRPYMND